MKYIGFRERNLGVLKGIRWNPDGETIAICGTRGVSLFDRSLNKIGSLKMPDDEFFSWLDFNSVAWNSEGNQLAGAYRFGAVVIWDILSGDVISCLETKLSHLGSVRWSSDDMRIASAGDKGVVQIWESATGKLATTFHYPYRQRRIDRIAELLILLIPGVVKCQEFHNPLIFRDNANWSPDNTKIAGLAPGNQIRVWDAETYDLMHTLQGHKGQPLSISWSPDSTEIASAGQDRAVFVWDAAKGAKSRSWKVSSEILSIAWSPDGKSIAGATRFTGGRAGSYEPTITIWDSSDGSILLTVINHVTAIEDLDWNPEGTRIAAIDSGGIIEIWEVV